ncbi:hypothetical protein CYMTET_28124 [Cymbomonas tetramitiformis]|uniref:EGF-like domain-containing protein n=1 Tax=Cymbomonas tetramitiformis TaxID=36881 RepID=A0AAE0FNS5_9CHLO|nr:hypothetical protein CYMTET_28124 [Cymbomonas tetramitiformis]
MTCYMSDHSRPRPIHLLLPPGVHSPRLPGPGDSSSLRQTVKPHSPVLFTNGGQVAIISVYAGSVVMATTVTYTAEDTAAGASSDAFVALLGDSTSVANIFAGSAVLRDYASSATASLTNSTSSVAPTADAGMPGAVDGVPPVDTRAGMPLGIGGATCPSGYSAVYDSACVDTDGCALAPCFPGVECADEAAPGEGFICGSCPEGYRGDGVSCELCELQLMYVPEMSTVVGGEMKRSVTNQLSASCSGLSETDCVLTQGINYWWDAVISDGATFPLDSTTNMRDTLTLYLPKSSLTANTAYSMQLTAALRGNSEVAAHVDTFFQVKSEPLVALIQGGPVQTGTGIPVELDAGVSYDPDGAPGEMVYSWTCVRTDGAAPDPYCRSAADSARLPAAMPTSLLSLSLLGAAGEGAQYTLSCQVSKGDRQAAANTTVTVLEGPLPVPAITPLSRKHTANSKLTLSSEAASLSPETLSLSWSLRAVDEATDAMDLAEVAATALNLPNLVLRADSLMPGGVYLFALAAEDRHGAAWATLQVQVNSPPHSGGVTVSPSEGVMAETVFTFEGSGWDDDLEDKPLWYQLRYEVVGAGEGWKMLTQWQPSPLFSEQMNAAGLEGSGHLVAVRLYVKDMLEATAFEGQDITVRPLVFEDEAAKEEFLDAGINAAAQGVANGRDTSADVVAMVNVLSSPEASPREARRRRLLTSGAEPRAPAVSRLAQRAALMEVMGDIWNILPQTTDTVTRVAQGGATVVAGDPEELTEQTRAQFSSMAASLVAITLQGDPDARLEAPGAVALMEGLSSVTVGAVAAHGANHTMAAGTEVAAAVDVARSIGFSNVQGMVPEEDPVSVCTEVLCSLAQRADLRSNTSRALAAPVTAPSGAAVSFAGSLGGELGDAAESVDIMLVGSAADPHLNSSGPPGTAASGGTLLASDVTSVSLYSRNGDELVVRGLEEAITLTLPLAAPGNLTSLPPADQGGGGGAAHAALPVLGASCAFWDGTAGRYSSEGCTSMPNPSPSGAALSWRTLNVSQLAALEAAWSVEHTELMAGCEEVWGAHYPEYRGADAGRRKYVGADCQLADPGNNASCWWDWHVHPEGAFRGAGCVLAVDTRCLCTHLTDFAAVQPMEFGSLKVPDRVSAYSSHEMKRVSLSKVGKSEALLGVLAVLLLGAPFLYLLSNLAHNAERLQILRRMVDPCREFFREVDGVWTWTFIETDFYAGKSLSLRYVVDASIQENKQKHNMLNMIAGNLMKGNSMKKKLGKMRGKRLITFTEQPVQGRSGLQLSSGIESCKRSMPSERRIARRIFGLSAGLSDMFPSAASRVLPFLSLKQERVLHTDELLKAATLDECGAESEGARSFSKGGVSRKGVVVDANAATCAILPPKSPQQASKARALFLDAHGVKLGGEDRNDGLASALASGAPASAAMGNASISMQEGPGAGCTDAANRGGPVVESYLERQPRRTPYSTLGTSTPQEMQNLLGSAQEAKAPPKLSRVNTSRRHGKFVSKEMQNTAPLMQAATHEEMMEEGHTVATFFSLLQVRLR